ncbi:MAG: cupin domain-containing protein, partial [Mesorhizobium sp.]
MTTQKATVFRPDQIPAHERGGGAKTIPLVNRASGTTSFINGITIFEPGAAIPLHRHN